MKKCGNCDVNLIILLLCAQQNDTLDAILKVRSNIKQVFCLEIIRAID